MIEKRQSHGGGNVFKVRTDGVGGLNIVKHPHQWHGNLLTDL